MQRRKLALEEKASSFQCINKHESLDLSDQFTNFWLILLTLPVLWQMASRVKPIKTYLCLPCTKLHFTMSYTYLLLSSNNMRDVKLII